jgi:hypothetical protein
MVGRQDGLPVIGLRRLGISRRLVPFLAAGAFAVAGIVSGWEGAALWKVHTDGVDSWSIEVHHAAVEVADILVQALHDMDDDLTHDLVPATKEVLTAHADPDALLVHYGRAIERHRQIAFIAAFTAQGDLVATTDPTLRRLRATARGRDFLKFFADGGQGRHVTGALLTGPAIAPDAPVFLLLTRRIDRSDGALAGIVVAAMAPDFLLQTMIDPSLYLDKDVRLFLDNGKLLGVHRDDADRIGETFGTHPLFQGASTGSQWGVLSNPFEDGPEIAALERTDGLPFLVSVFTENGPNLVGWWHRPVFLLAYAAVSFAACLVFLIKGLWGHHEGGAGPVR